VTLQHWVFAMHAALHILNPVAQVVPHMPAVQVATVFVGAGHDVHDVPHVIGEVSLTHVVPHRC